MEKIVVLTGAGMSADSGISTFRDANGLWEGHNIIDVASPIGWKKNKELVLDFYNERRKQLLKVKPNDGHISLVELEKYFDVSIITQNIDDLHERAGSSKIIHLHGELLKARSTEFPYKTYDWKTDLKVGDKCEKGAQLRPHIVWFGEEVPMLEAAIEVTQEATILIIVGTSMQVYPAASLIDFVQSNTLIYFIDPKPSITQNYKSNLKIIAKNSAIGTPKLVTELIHSMK